MFKKFPFVIASLAFISLAHGQNEHTTSASTSNTDLTISLHDLTVNEYGASKIRVSTAVVSANSQYPIGATSDVNFTDGSGNTHFSQQDSMIDIKVAELQKVLDDHANEKPLTLRVSAVQIHRYWLNSYVGAFEIPLPLVETDFQKELVWPSSGYTERFFNAVTFNFAKNYSHLFAIKDKKGALEMDFGVRLGVGLPEKFPEGSMIP